MFSRLRSINADPNSELLTRTPPPGHEPHPDTGQATGIRSTVHTYSTHDIKGYLVCIIQYVQSLAPCISCMLKLSGQCMSKNEARAVSTCSHQPGKFGL